MYVHTHFCAENCGKDKLESNGNCECASKNCERGYFKSGRPKCTKWYVQDLWPGIVSVQSHLNRPTVGRRQFAPVWGPPHPSAPGLSPRSWSGKGQAGSGLRLQIPVCSSSPSDAWQHEVSLLGGSGRSLTLLWPHRTAQRCPRPSAP